MTTIRSLAGLMKRISDALWAASWLLGSDFSEDNTKTLIIYRKLELAEMLSL